jgi:ribosomal-protein-alanine N-acetyltransferase
MVKTYSEISTIPGDPVAIEPANWRDLNAVRTLEQVCFPLDAWPVWDIIGVLTLPNVVRLKAVAGSRLVGFIAGDLRPAERLAWIATVGVLPEYRGRGIGAALLKACEARMNAPRIRLNVRVSNDAAIRLYRRFQYYQVGTWSRYYQDGEDALILEKKRG